MHLFEERPSKESPFEDGDAADVEDTVDDDEDLIGDEEDDEGESQDEVERGPQAP